MKRILAASIAALSLVLAVPTMASPNPADLVGIDPTTHFVVTRILPNQREVVLLVIDWNDGTLATEQVVRVTALEAARQNRTNNPSWRIVIYGPIDPPSTFYTNGDRVWDSAVDL